MMIEMVGLALVMVGNIVLIDNTSAASHTLTLTSSGSQSINVSTSAGTAISSDAINVTTTCRYGYNFTISTSVEDNNLYLNGDSSNNADGTYFEPIDGISPLNSTTNTWGFHYSSNPSNVPTGDSIFQPLYPTTLKYPLDTPASSDINDNFNIYYGVSASPTMAKGTYKMIPDTNNSNNDGTIVYTATIADACTKYTVHFSPTSEFEGSTISGTGTMGDQTILEGITTPLTSNGFTAPSGYYFVGWNTAQDGSGTSYTDQQQVTDLITAGNTITLYAQWTDCPPNTFCYTANGNNVIGEMGTRTITDTATYITLNAPNFKNAGYGFASWNTKKNGTGVDYGPNQVFEFNAGQYNTSGQKLYAKWVANAGDMQNWSGCNGMNIGDVTALKDTRDNDVYAVAKLADGKCWMIENLRLDNVPTLSSSNTNNPSLPLTNVYDTSSRSNHLSPTSAVPYDVTTAPEGWCNANTAACLDQSRVRTDNTTLFINNTAANYDFGGDVYSYGNYYNWYSATAGRGTTSITNNNTSTTGDICPTGWYLPKGGDRDNTTNSDFWRLAIALIGVEPANTSSQVRPSYSGSTEGANASRIFRLYPNNFVYSGSHSASSATIDGRNSSGYVSSSTAINGVSQYYYSFANYSVNPGTNHSSRFAGRPVRCIVGT